MSPSPSNCRLPDFIGIGAMRSGTSWLGKQLKQHPGIWTASPKELHFFDRHFTNSPQAYARHFSDAPAEMAAGEITPAYAILDTGKIAAQVSVRIASIFQCSIGFGKTNNLTDRLSSKVFLE
mgnify:CR=1 FL=1